MNKVVVLVLADVDTTGDLGRVVNALQTTKEFKDRGDEVRLVFDGAGLENWDPPNTSTTGCSSL